MKNQQPAAVLESLADPLVAMHWMADYFALKLRLLKGHSSEEDFDDELMRLAKRRSAARDTLLGNEDEEDSGEESISDRKKTEKRKLSVMRNAIRRDEALCKEALCSIHERLTPLSTKLGLSEAEVKCLILALAIRISHAALDMADAVYVDNATHRSRSLSRILDVPEADVRSLAHGTSRLHQLGILSVSDMDCRIDFKMLLAIPDRLVSAYTECADLVEAVMRSGVTPAPLSLLSESDFSYCSEDLALIRAALSRPEGAGNVLLVGFPGLGKTQLARLVGQQLQRKVFEVNVLNHNQQPADRQDRFSAYSVTCQLMSNPQDTLIIFDECEDVFEGEHWVHIRSNNERHKGWTNQLLERRSVSTIWIANHVFGIDPAYLRRFDYVFKMQEPPQSVRYRMLSHAVAGHPVPASVLERIAQSDRLTPADCERAGRLIGNALLQDIKPEVALTKIIACRPYGVRMSQIKQGRDGVRLPFDMSWIQTDGNLKRIVDGLKARGSGTLAFCGPPGTGKTEFVRQMAQMLDRSLHLKKASDLLSKYVGGTERLIAEAFEDAEREGAILFLDEADSFLRSREAANHSWEITQVNELLAQLDQSNGIVVLATNHSQNLDPALIRRMDFKLNFGYLSSDAAVSIFAAGMEKLRGTGLPVSDASRRQLSGMRELAFGDFAAALRRISIEDGEVSENRLIEALQEELRHKAGWRSRPAIGFTCH